MGWILLQIATGGALGAVGRYLSGIAAHRLLGDGFPYGTMAVNVLGCLTAGAVFALLAESGTGQPKVAPLVLTGFLGGYTTFSAYSLDAWQLYNSGRAVIALMYAAGTLAVSMAALVAGIMIARELFG